MKKVRWIKVQFDYLQGKGRAFWVSERNPYFDWYKRSSAWIVLREEIRYYDDNGKLVKVEKVV
ncbi:MAG: hypothetical protein DRJ35_02920 [Thermoprotei archaeon]|nr:MAG: hypothetical protein DRJ35_02920 [Thermoprotei archaeon]